MDEEPADHLGGLGDRVLVPVGAIACDRHGVGQHVHVVYSVVGRDEATGQLCGRLLAVDGLGSEDSTPSWPVRERSVLNKATVPIAAEDTSILWPIATSYRSGRSPTPGVVCELMDTQIQDALDRGGIADIVTTGRKTGLPRRVEIYFHQFDGEYYLTGRPGFKRDWEANIKANPELHPSPQARPGCRGDDDRRDRA